jgi:hypothetical protein
MGLIAERISVAENPAQLVGFFRRHRAARTLWQKSFRRSMATSFAPAADDVQ